MNDRLLVVAGVLGIAAYILATEEASAAPDSSGGTANVNGWANNNPGNLIYITNDPFRGQTGDNGGFGVYDTLADGVRAMGLTLTQYYNAGLKSVSQIIMKYSQTDQAAYIKNVSDWMQVDPNEPLSWPQDEVPLIQAMIRQEQGSSQLSDADVQSYINS